MAQTRNNNLSPLPFYSSLAEQECRLPWAFGDVYPLRCGGERIPNFFIVRSQRGEFVSEGTELNETGYFDGYVQTDGTLFDGSGSGVSEYEVPSNRYIWVENLPYPVSVAGTETTNVAFYDAAGSFVSSKVYGTVSERYTGLVPCPPKAAFVQIQKFVGDSEDVAVAYQTISQPTSIKECVAVSCEDGSETELDYVLENIQIFNYGDTDTIISYGGRVSLENGTYYLRLSDGVQTWYSEMFCYGAMPTLLLMWQDVTDQRLPEGVIPYSKGYRNVVLLNTSVGRPEYETEKEGDERDGYFFMEKGISRKSYKFTFYAPEYLCDALRLVPVSDKVVISDTSRGVAVRYDVDDIDMEVEWLEQGNYAQVTFTFHTDTVVKNLGKIL